MSLLTSDVGWICNCKVCVVSNAKLTLNVPKVTKHWKREGKRSVSSSEMPCSLGCLKKRKMWYLRTCLWIFCRTGSSLFNFRTMSKFHQKELQLSFQKWKTNKKHCSIVLSSKTFEYDPPQEGMSWIPRVSLKTIAKSQQCRSPVRILLLVRCCRKYSCS